MSTHPPERLTRFAVGASDETKRNFGKSLISALDRLGVEPGTDFIVLPAHEQPTLMEQLDQPQMGAFVKDSETSRKAALDNYPKSGSQRKAVLLEIAKAGDHGRTREELSTRLQLDDNSVRPRVVELMVGDFVRETERARPTRTGSDAAVVVLTAKGMTAVREHDAGVVHDAYASAATDA